MPTKLTGPTVFLTALLVLFARPIAAQEMAGPRAQISISPILALAEWYTGEVEYAFSDEMSGVLGFSFFSLNNDYRALDAKLRFYPDGTPLEGFNIAGLVGYTSISLDPSDDEVSGFTAGVDLGVSWLFGERKRWFFGLGLGAKRYFGDDNLGGEPLDPFLPTARVNFGIAF